MCGITGIISLIEPCVDRAVLEAMSKTIASRGPDDEGFYYSDHAGLAHRRLSIIDLKTGHQPMTSTDQRYTIIFNGEIYNFKELREELIREDIPFQTTSDTEVLLALFMRRGESCLDRLNGMFAFAIWDKQNKTLFAARDRMGKKPFYYGLVHNHFIFASELKALLKFPQLQKEINPEAVAGFFNYESVPAPLSIIKGISKLPQGHFLKLENGKVEIKRYWNQSFSDKIELDEKSAAKMLLERLDQAVSYRLISDVPVGVFLSGGIDSSTVVALMARQRAAKDIQTFSINFKEASFDESLYSSTVAKAFGTNHHEETLTANLMLDILPEVTSYLDEPFADASILPTFLLSRFTRKSVTVALGGDGADELFAGYPTFIASRMARLYQRSPTFLKRATARLSRLLPTSDKNMSLDFKVRQFLAGALETGPIQNQIWLSGFFPTEQKQLFSDTFSQTLQDYDPMSLITKEMQNCDATNPGDELLYFYQKFYMCDDILFKVDRASMANSLEVRAPFLDPQVVEFANNLPFELKLKGVTTKYLLKKAMNRMLPAMITQRSKKGFGIPISSWLKNELKPVLLSTFNEKRIEQDGFFNWDFINSLIQQHLNGKRNNRKQLFSLLMFHFWMDEYFK